MRIVSLVPSITELLFDLGLSESIVGRTKFCIHPHQQVKKVTIVGGTKNFHHQRITSLNPDLIIANKEENLKSDVEPLMQSYEVLLTDIKTINDAISMIRLIAAKCEVVSKGEELIATINKLRQDLQSLNVIPRKASYLIWKEPLMTVGGDTFIHAMMKEIGIQNVFGDQRRYPSVTMEDIAERKPDLIMLSSEPFPFSSKHVEEFTKSLSGIKTILVDGEHFSWYGSRMIKAYQAFLSGRLAISHSETNRIQ